MAAADKPESGSSEGPRWYSISEAAEYLQVSEPTIFRWMRDRLLSFYKVGGSTRFTQESLDALIEKTTGRKEAEAAAGRCAACGHNVLIDGKLRGAGRLYFQPDKAKFWYLGDSFVATRALVCPACGCVQLRADASKLRRLEPAGRKRARSKGVETEPL